MAARDYKKVLYFLLCMCFIVACMAFVYVNNELHNDMNEVYIFMNMPISINSINGTVQTFAFMIAMLLPCIDGVWGTRIGVGTSGFLTFTTIMKVIRSGSMIPIPGVLNGIFSIIAILIIGSLFRNAEKKMVTDILTGLMNLRGFYGQLDRMLSDKKPFALALIQIDNFRSINDEYGHSFGDQALKITGKRIKDAVGKKGSVSRITGAQFAIIIYKNENSEQIINDAVRRISEKLEIGKDGSPVNCYLDAVAGIAVFPKDATDKDELNKYADIALMHASDSDNPVAVFDDNMFSDMLHQKEVERLVKDALANNYLYFDYQPQFSIENKELRGFEALIRMKLPDERIISPAEFIPIAELSSLIYQIDDYAVERVVREFAPYVKKAEKKVMISVNISANGFAREEFTQNVERILKKYDFPPECLEIEITEYSFAVSSEQTMRSVHNLKKMNCNIALDDFGTGYTSLSQLMNVSANLLKVDKSLVDDITHSELNSEFVKTIGSMGHLLDCEVVFEGVETLEQVEKIKNLECDYIQGYVWSKPIHFEEAVKMI